MTVVNKGFTYLISDEIDSILSSRRSNEHEASRRMKTEFFASMDGLESKKDDKILVIGATNRPEELDTAAIRRFSKRIYIPMPDHDSRALLIASLLAGHNSPLSARSENLKTWNQFEIEILMLLVKLTKLRRPLRDIPARTSQTSAKTQHLDLSESFQLINLLPFRKF